jgi:hypothetical protein
MVPRVIVAALFDFVDGEHRWMIASKPDEGRLMLVEHPAGARTETRVTSSSRALNTVEREPCDIFNGSSHFGSWRRRKKQQRA